MRDAGMMHALMAKRRKKVVYTPDGEISEISDELDDGDTPPAVN
jgi:hypothetical protein